MRYRPRKHTPYRKRYEDSWNTDSEQTLKVGNTYYSLIGSEFHATDRYGSLLDRNGN
ncbi:hypothetical protein J2Z48_002675 [Croceifilum oryzae]|uniref:Uncharacterized protein n=1 Tax=Croceifilum oryzae TaxID=1553429 RepID=A0AAJ1WTY2_9BACL|nr:hypothetical protein [Croceifilum oryzae]